MFRKFLATMMFVAAGLAAAEAQEDALGVPGPLVFEGVEFALAWTSHPSDTYYKQEYVPAGQVVEAYEQMFMIDVVISGMTAEAAAATMVDGLKQRQAIDPVVNFAMIANEATGEIILDFLLSDSSSGPVIVEWNAYRYVPRGDGVMLVAISRRGYDDNASPFIAGLKAWREASIEELANWVVPEISLTE